MGRVVSVDFVSNRINGMLAGLTPNAPECCIFRVHTQLRKTNEKAYEPIMLAIGPYHRGKYDLRLMEDHKLRYLQLLLQRRNESSVETYIEAMRELEERAREFYAEPISLSPEELVEMMLLDGFFIIELFRKFARNDSIDKYDPIFRLSWMLSSLGRDLLLFENQIPLFVLTKLFEMTEVPNQQDNLTNLAMRFFKCSLWLPGEGHISESSDHESLQNIRHLLALVHKSVTPSEEIGIALNFELEYNSIPSATELQKTGVKLKKLESRGSTFDIKFNNGVLEIPPLEIEDQSESIFRNLIAYEQYSQHYDLQYVTDYVSFMDNLINYPKDVELLRQRGIIKNLLGDDEAVSTMFNKLGGGVWIYNFFYTNIFRDVNKYYSNKQCGRLRKVWMANLRQKYFSSPWALISLLAAAFLLLLALTQTIFSVLSYLAPIK